MSNFDEGFILNSLVRMRGYLIFYFLA
jgi:hypothetical protein